LPGESKTIDMEINYTTTPQNSNNSWRSKIDGVVPFAEFMVMKSWC
jgi:hypothetical protein